jgi:hypothetical protein
VSPTELSARARLVTTLRFPVLVFVVWRVLHGLVVLVFGGSPVEATYSFDASYYLQLLREGYVLPAGGYTEFSDVPFFPGLAWISWAVLQVVRHEQAATLLVANGLALAAFVTVRGAVRAWTDEGMARRVTLGLALAPTSYFLWMYYTEALLITATAAAAWAARRERHAGAAVLLAVASTARVVGVATGPALALARIVRLRRVDGVSVLYVAGSLVGFAAVLLRQAIEIGDPLGWTKAQEAWDREFAAPWVGLTTAVRDIVGTLPGIAEGVALDLVTVLVVGTLVVLLWRGVRARRWPQEPALLATVLWAVPLFTRLISSQVRFALGCWPVLLVPAAAWPRLPRVVRAAVVLGAVALSVVLLRRLAHGAFTA